MGKLTVNGLDALIDDFADLAKLPDSVVEDILNAEADIIAAEQKKTAREMGVYDTGMTAGSIKKGKVKKTGLDHSISIYPQGKNKRGESNAEVAFVNEFGAPGRRIKARPFIKTANERKEKEAVEAGEKVYHAYLDGKKL